MKWQGKHVSNNIYNMYVTVEMGMSADRAKREILFSPRWNISPLLVEPATSFAALSAVILSGATHIGMRELSEGSSIPAVKYTAL